MEFQSQYSLGVRFVSWKSSKPKSNGTPRTCCYAATCPRSFPTWRKKRSSPTNRARVPTYAGSAAISRLLMRVLPLLHGRHRVLDMRVRLEVRIRVNDLARGRDHI